MYGMLFEWNGNSFFQKVSITTYTTVESRNELSFLMIKTANDS